MTITWFGQACFRISAKGGGATGGEPISILIDPFEKEIGLRVPRINDNIVLVTHDHYDHNNAKDLESSIFVINTPGEYERSGVQIVGISSFHDDEKGEKRGLNTIYLIKVEDIRICHLGDLGQHELTPEQIEMIGNVDVLMIPVGGTYTIDGKEAAEVVKQIEPKMILPMHYKVPGLKIDLDGPQTFIKELGIKPEEVENLKISSKNMPEDEIKLFTFKL